MPSIQLDKILENISLERALYKNEEKTKKTEEEAWKRVASNNNITMHEAKAIYNVLIRKFNTEKAKGNSTWKMYDIMQNIQEGFFQGQEEKEKEENEGMVELMEVFEEEDSASDNNSELDKSNGSSGSKTSGISTRSSSTSNKGSPEVPQRKLLNTNMIPIPNASHAPQKSPVFIPPNLQKVNLKPAQGSAKKEAPLTNSKRKAELAQITNAAIAKRPAILGSKPKPPLVRNSLQASQVSGSTEGSSNHSVESSEISNLKVESTTPVKSENVANGYLESPQNQHNDDVELKLPPNFFKNLCSSSRHEAFGLYLANFMNRLDKTSAKKLELRLLQTITDFQAENDN